MAQRVFTANGPGRVVQSDIVRGRESFLVEGDGFSRWFFANELNWEETPATVNRGNSTTLPYDPTPQTPSNSGISTILPGAHPLDRADRLKSTDSLTGEGRDGESQPGPNPDLFADTTMGDSVYQTDTILPGQQDLYHTSTRILDASAVGADRSQGQWVVLAEDYGDRFQTDSYTLAKWASERPESFCGGYRDSRVAGLANPFEDYEALIRTSSTMRESAWADVRAKAVRLRHTGCVDVVDEDTKSIMANVQGDHGRYETFVIRQGHLTGNSGISEWSCNCEWGHWAFRRKRSFVGRMCSHAYAAYLELQSSNFRKKRRSASVGEDYLPMGKYVDEKLDMPSELRLEPEGLVPEYNVVERPDRKITRDKLSVRQIRAASDEKLLEDLRSLSEETHRPQHESERADEISEVVEELRERGYDADNITAMLRNATVDTGDYETVADQLTHEPFAGSGPSDHHELSTSEDSVGDWYDDRLESHDMTDPARVPTDPGHTTESEMDKWRLNAAIEDPEASGSDLVAAFQKNAGWIMSGETPGGAQGDGDIAGAAQAFLRTAGRNYSFAEQQELIDEGRQGAASNLKDLDLRGTHYTH